MPGLPNTAMRVQTERNDHTAGLILKQTDYKDYDVLLSVLTKEYGLLSFRAAGARKMTSKNAGSIFPYTIADMSFDYKPGRTMFRLKSARTISLYRHLHEDLSASSAAAVIGEVTESFASFDASSVSLLYAETEKAFAWLDQGKNTNLVLCLFLSDVMKFSGFAPEVDQCVVCGSSKVHALSAKEGGFLCTEHALECKVPLSEAVDLRRFRLIVKAGIDRLEIVEKAGGCQEKDLEVLENILLLHSGLRFKSFSLYNRLALY